MKFMALLDDGHLYIYDPTDLNDRELWFEDFDRNHVVKVFHMNTEVSRSGYQSEGYEVDLQFAMGVFTMAEQLSTKA